MRCFLFLFCVAISVFAEKGFSRHSSGHVGAALATPYSVLGFENANVNPEYTLFLNAYATEAYAANCQYSCYASLSPHAQQWVEMWDPNGFIRLQYDVCSGKGGDGSCSGYVGHVEINFTPTYTSVKPLESVMLTGTGSPFFLTFALASCSTVSFPSPSSYSGVSYRGVNLAGGEFDSGFQLPCPSDALYFVNQGMNIVRIPFKWEYLQSPDFLGYRIDFNSGNAKTLLDLTNTLTAAKIYVILDMHNYMRYNGAVIGVDSGAPTVEQYAIAWASIALPFKDNPYVFFDLMNEPHDMSTEQILANYNAAIESIRAEGANNLILLEGNQYACLAAWGGNNYTRSNAYGTSPCYYGTPNSDVFTPENIADPANNYAINVHEYFSDPNGCGSEGECINPADVLTAEMFEPFTNWLYETKQRAMVTELNGIASSNCIGCITNFLTAVQGAPNQVVDSQNTGGFIGWCGWAGGTAWPESYEFNLEPFSNGDQREQMLEGFEPNLTAP